MALALLNNDFIISLTTRTDVGATEIGNLPVGIAISELRWNSDTTSIVIMSETTAVTSMWVELDTNNGFILHCCDSTNYDSQLVIMTWDDRGNLINDNGTIRVKTPAELAIEVDTFEFDRGIIRSENTIEKQIDYTRKVPTDNIITDKSRRDPNALKVLYNGLDANYITIDTTTDLAIDSTSEIDYWIQYRFPTEYLIKNVFNFGEYFTDSTTNTIVAAYYSYSLNGEDWTYLANDTTAETDWLIEYDTFAEARQHYVTLTDALVVNDSIIFRFLKGVSAKYFRIHFLAPTGLINQTNFNISELRFDQLTHGSTVEDATVDTITITPRAITNLTVIQTETGVVLCDDITNTTQYVFYTAEIDDEYFVYSLTGDGYDYQITGDVIDGVTLNNLGSLESIWFLQSFSIINADAATLIDGQDESNYNGAGGNGQFNGGSDYNVLDTITLSCGSIITVDAVSGGEVTQFTVDAVTGDNFLSLYSRRQVETSGIGYNFYLLPNEITNFVGTLEESIPFGILIQRYSAYFDNSTLVYLDTTNRRNISSVVINLEYGTQYNIGYSCYVTRDAVGAPTGNIDVSAEFRFINLLKVKR